MLDLDAARIRRGFALAVILALPSVLCAASAQADAIVWYDMIVGDGVEISSGAGQRLIIETDTDPGPHDFVIRMKTNLLMALTSWSLDLLEFEGTASIVSASYLGPFWFNDPLVTGGQLVILDNAGQFGGPPIGGVPDLLEFTLRIDVPPGGSSTISVFSGIGGGGWSPSMNVHFGDAPPIPGASIGAVTTVPSIQIRRVPEPRSAWLIAAVFAVVARR